MPIPTSLTHYPYWLTGNLGAVKSQPDKAPVIDGRLLKVTDRSNLRPFSEVEEEVGESEGLLGLGFCFTGSEFVGIDLDIKEVDGEEVDQTELKTVVKVFKHIAAKSGTYAELSNSGKGIHIIGKLNQITPLGIKVPCVEALQNKYKFKTLRIQAEVYNHGRYFLLTGNTLPDTVEEIEVVDSWLKSFLKLIGRSETVKDETVANTPASDNRSRCGLSHTLLHSPTLDDKEVLTHLKGSSNAIEFITLHEDGDISGHADDLSAAVMSWHGQVCFYTQDLEQITRLFNESALAKLKKGKWKQKWMRLRLKQHLEICGNLTAAWGCEELETESGADKLCPYVSLLIDHFGEPRRDLFTQEMYVWHEGRWKNVFESEIFNKIKYECQKLAERREDFKYTHIEPAFYSHQLKLKPRLLIDIPQWDGKDRIGELVSCLKFEHEKMKYSIAVDLIKDVMARMWDRAHDSRIQNRCIILGGNQGIGKDIWLDTLIGGLEHYKTNIVFDRNTTEKDIVESTTDSCAILISEFDKVKNIESCVLKDIISKDHFKTRTAYSRKARRYDNHCTYFGACNPEQILTDTTGNRRFMVFRLAGDPGEAILWDYPTNSASYKKQVIAQAKALSRAGYKASEESEKVLKLITTEYSPDNPVDDAMEDYDQMMSERVSERGAAWLFRYDDISVDMQRISRRYGLRLKDMQTTIKASGRMHRHKEAGRFYGRQQDIKNKTFRREFVRAYLAGELEDTVEDLLH